MTIRKLISISSISCLLALSGCEETDPEPGLDDDEHGRVHDDDDDDERPRPNAGDSRDAGSADGKSPSAPSTGAPGAAAHIFLPTGEPTNTSAPVVEVDAAGNTHVLYPAYARGNAYYSFCAAGSCSDAKQAQMVKFPTDGTVGSVMLALTADGKPRILLGTFQHVYYGSCDQNCGSEASWQFGQILDHGSDMAVNGEALALDPSGRPRFLVHAVRNPLYPLTPRRTDTQLAECDASCHLAASWRFGTIASKEIWDYPSLRYDAGGKAHVATFVYSYGEQASAPIAGYLSCTGSCNTENTWTGAGLLPPFESQTEAVRMTPAISLALTRAGAPRIAMIAKTPEGKKRIAYMACDSGCEKDGWSGGGIWDADAINAGIDLALDASDRPRIAHTMNYDIVITYCDASNCTAPNSAWDSSFVEKGSEIPVDTIFLEWNCTIGAWFLHSPSIALTRDGKPRVGYQSRDVSGGVSRPDPTKPRCVAGTDMTFSRLGLLDTHK